MTGPLVSAILSVRDGERYLAEALDSIVNQQRKDLEVIVVDDGSRDASVEVAKQHRVSPQVLVQRQLGVSAALNHAIRIARGQYLTFLDCDDIWPPGRLTAMLESTEWADTDCVVGKVVNTDERLNPITAAHTVRLLGALLIKRTSALRVGEFRTDLAHAAIIAWISRAEALGLKFFNLDQLVLVRRIHGGNFGIRDHRMARGDLLRAIREHHNRKRQ